MNYPLITVLILNWNRPDSSIKAVESIKMQTYPNIEVLIVDNNSTDGSVSIIKKRFPEITIIKLDKNYGCPGGRNKGIKLSNGEFIFFVDDDGLLHKEAVLTAYKEISKNEKIAIVTGSVKQYKSLIEIDLNSPIIENRSYFTNTFQGGICLHRKSIYKEAGFYPDNFMYGAEERHLSFRVMDRDLVILKSPNVILWHPKKDVTNTNNLVTAWFNSLITAIQLYPYEMKILFLIKFIVVYPFYAKKYGVFKEFIIKLRGEFLTILIKNKFINIKRKTFYKYLKLNYNQGMKYFQ